MIESTRRRIPAALMLVFMLVGCSMPVALPNIGSDGNSCRGVGVEGILQGNPSDRRVAWIESHLGGGVHRIEAVFPPGFTARFTPRLEVLDKTGRVVARGGDPITGGCVTGQNADGPLLILGVGSPDIR